MIQQLVTCIEPIIKGLPFVQNYGGLVQCVTKTSVNDQTGLITKTTFPVTCKAAEVDPNCFKKGGYSAIIPGKCKSLFYFEASDIIPVGCKGPKGKTYVWKGTLTLIGWLDLRALGVAICGDISFVLGCIFTSGIIGKCHFDGPLKGVGKIGLPKIRLNDYKIFAKYSYYEKLKDKLIYPYQFFALDFPFTIEIQESCIDQDICTPDENQEPIICKVV